jgi:simple sugar transport system permease protein
MDGTTLCPEGERMTYLDFLLIFDSSLRLATPLILCAMAGLVSERAGIVDIGLEGKLLGGAFAAAAVASITGSAWLGLFAAIASSVLLSMIHGFACITHKGEQIISGIAINILASGATVVASVALFKRGGQTPTLDREERFSPLELPGANTLSDVPWFGPFWKELISGHTLPVYIAMVSVPLVWWLLWRTRFGLRLRAVGEMPAAVDSAGLSVTWLRYRALIIAGILCGIAGAFLSTAHGAGFVREMSAGKGYIALAAMIFGKWRPWSVLAACLLFGFLEAGANRMQGTPLPLVGEVPIEVVLILPYVATVVLLAGFFGKAIPPRALGTPYRKER